MIPIIFKAFRKLNDIFIKLIYNQLGKVLFFVNGAHFGKKLIVNGSFKLKVTRRGVLEIGDHCRFNSGLRYNVSGGNQKCHFWIEGNLKIGDNVGISSSSILCRHKITIGDNVTIGGGTLIIDTDSHSVNSKDRGSSDNDFKKANWGPVNISDHVFIGARCIILKNISIGENSIIAAGSTVTKNIPANEIWGGNPAKKIRTLS